MPPILARSSSRHTAARRASAVSLWRIVIGSSRRRPRTTAYDVEEETLQVTGVASVGCPSPTVEHSEVLQARPAGRWRPRLQWQGDVMVVQSRGEQRRPVLALRTGGSDRLPGRALGCCHLV